MSEYKTLKEWFGDATRGDGRKFTRHGDWALQCFFEPIFSQDDFDTGIRRWHGLDEQGRYFYELDDACDNWKEWHPPKEKKKITLYRPIIKFGPQYIYGSWSSLAKENHSIHMGEVVGREEREIEVDE